MILLNLYWWNGARRHYIKKRIPGPVSQLLKTTSRNISLMIKSEKKFKLKGSVDALKDGAVLYSFHFGIWEKMPEILHNYIKKDIGVLINRYTENNLHFIGRIMDKFFYHWRAKKNIKIFYPDEVFQIVRFIKSGGIFSALVDGDTFYAKFHKIKRLAELCNVPLVPFAIYYEKENGVMELGCNLIELLKFRPFDYWWFYKSRRR